MGCQCQTHGGASLTLGMAVIGGLMKISEDGMLPHGHSVSVTSGYPFRSVDRFAASTN